MVDFLVFCVCCEGSRKPETICVKPYWFTDVVSDFLDPRSATSNFSICPQKLRFWGPGKTHRGFFSACFEVRPQHLKAHVSIKLSFDLTNVVSDFPGAPSKHHAKLPLLHFLIPKVFLGLFLRFCKMLSLMRVLAFYPLLKESTQERSSADGMPEVFPNLLPSVHRAQRTLGMFRAAAMLRLQA